MTDLHVERNSIYDEASAFEDVSSDVTTEPLLDICNENEIALMDNSGHVEIETVCNSEEAISWSGSVFGNKSVSGTGDIVDALLDGFRYIPTRVSYQYATHYKLHSDNLRREPLSTFGNLERFFLNSSNHEESKKLNVCDTVLSSTQLYGKRKRCLAVALVQIFIGLLLFGYYAKYTGTIDPMSSDGMGNAASSDSISPHENFLVWVKSFFTIISDGIERNSTKATNVNIDDVPKVNIDDVPKVTKNVQTEEPPSPKVVTKGNKDVPPTTDPAKSTVKETHKSKKSIVTPPV